jgi:hypothetical protein
MSTLTEHFTLRLPDYWTPEQALAVYELLKDLADTIWNRYERVLIEQLRRDLEADDREGLERLLRYCARPWRRGTCTGGMSDTSG